MKKDNRVSCKKSCKKPYKKPAIVAAGNYSACMSTCGKLVNNVNSACGH